MAGWSGSHHRLLCSWQGYTMLRILVENCGRVNYGDNIDDQRKGGSQHMLREELLTLSICLAILSLSKLISRP